MKTTLKQWLALIGLAFFISGCEKSSDLYTLQITGSTMGTYYQVKVVDTKAQLPDGEALQALIDDELEAVNDEMSTYRPSSEISRFNQSEGSEPMAISSHFAYVMDASIALSEATVGAFDPTVGPLVNLWGFGPEGRPETIPSDEQVAQASAKVGYQHLSLQDGMLSKAVPELYLDLSAIAKGHGVDRVAEVLEAQGVANYLVDIGGELRLNGHNDKDAPWRIAVEKPVAGGTGAIQKIIAPGDGGLATSGDYRNYFEHDGVRYSHTINPATAKPIANKIVSVTVVTQSSMMADAYATAFTVMGVEASMAMAKERALAVYIIEKQGEEFAEHISDAFAPLIQQ
ncbi:FAD:protein FMN transferase [Aliagarivorans marinus]|uniref:FAD:protein FMN transferase n=1 Tax=Aliagarivorans marinus TaxID=561965 RepID=UPI00042036AA|nr:FAD:protein FMN transferase [Aliagarivorans marinus]